MSKYILVVDLPDDSKCTGCYAFCEREYNDLCNCTRRYPEYHYGEFSRLSDCPLIPVERAVERVKCGIISGTPSNEGEAAEHFLRDELGATECVNGC